MPWLKKNYLLVVLLLIILMGAFLRVYHFSDWLHFELDQSRDAKVIDEALENGPSNLPLLGPRAGGTFLRLGPAFYYLQYISGILFGATPVGLAVFVLIFSIASIVLFFFLFKRYFENIFSLALTALFACSLFFVLYSRFAWNPNLLPFFELLTLYALLRAVDREEKKPEKWFLIFVLTLTLASQLHFLGMIILSAFSAIFLLIKRPRYNWKIWLSAFFIALALYLPVIINDIKTKGANAKEFIEAISGKSEKDRHSFFEKAYENLNQHQTTYFLMLSGKSDILLPKIKQINNKKDIQCDSICRKNLSLTTTSLVLFCFGFIFLGFRFYKEPDGAKKDFLLAMGLLAIISFGLFLPLAFDIAPRFFLVATPLPFVLLGLVLNEIKIWLKDHSLALFIVLALILSNLFFVFLRFEEMAKAKNQAFDPAPDRILKEKTRVTLEQQKMIADYVISFYNQNHYPIYLNSEPQYRRAILYHVDRMGVPSKDVRGNKVYRQGNYFLVYITLSNTKSKVNKYLDKFDLISEKSFGTMSVFRLIPKEEFIEEERQDFSEQPKTFNPAVPRRFLWKEIFIGGKGQVEEEIDPEEEK